MLEFVVFCCAFSVLFLEWWLCLAVVLLLEASILHVCLWCCWYLAVEVLRVFYYGVMLLHASVLLNWVLLSEWSGRRGDVYDFGGLGCSQRLPLSVWVVPATLRVPVAGWPPKTGAGPTFQWAGRVDAICRSRSNRAKRPRAGCILRSCILGSSRPSVSRVNRSSDGKNTSMVHRWSL